MKNWKISIKLGVGFGVLICVLFGTGYLGLHNMGIINDNLDLIVQKTWRLSEWSQDAKERSTENGKLNLELFLMKNDSEIDRILNRVEENARFVSETMENIEKNLHYEQGKVLYAVVKEKRPLYVASFHRATRLLKEGKREEATNLLISETLPLLASLSDAWDKFSAFQASKVDEVAKEAESGYENARALVIALLTAGALFAMAISVLVTLGITGPIRQAVGISEKIAEGDLSTVIEVTRTDEPGMLLAALKKMSERLSKTIGEVRTAASSLSSASEQIAASTQSLSQGTSEQASSVEETTSSLEQMNASITQNSENSRQTEQMAAKGAKDSEESGKAVSETVDAMKSIAEKISIIEEIAYQTNLLALNAAIEAARAGEHGKGFAVVASEVRKLAERSQTASKEISQLAGSSVKMAERSGKLLADLVPSIRKTSELVQEVAAASREQASGVTQINRAMSQVDQVTQRNAASAEELSSTAEELASQAEELNQTMAFFKVSAYDGMSGQTFTGKHFSAQKIPATQTLHQKGGHFNVPGGPSKTHSAASDHSDAGHLDISHSGSASGNHDGEFKKF